MIEQHEIKALIDLADELSSMCMKYGLTNPDGSLPIRDEFKMLLIQAGSHFEAGAEALRRAEYKCHDS